MQKERTEKRKGSISDMGIAMITLVVAVALIGSAKQTFRYVFCWLFKVAIGTIDMPAGHISVAGSTMGELIAVLVQAVLLMSVVRSCAKLPAAEHRRRMMVMAGVEVATGLGLLIVLLAITAAYRWAYALEMVGEVPFWQSMNLLFCLSYTALAILGYGLIMEFAHCLSVIFSNSDDEDYFDADDEDENEEEDVSDADDYETGVADEPDDNN